MMISALQNKLLEMLEWFHKFCLSHNIKYYVTYGTMLGAARHNGFIPWDDDVDVCLPRQDYEKLKSLFKGKTEKYVLETPYDGHKDFLYSYAKLYDPTTTMVENSRFNCRRGVFIDIFPLDGIGNTYKESINNFVPLDRMNMFIAARSCALRGSRSIYKNAAIILARIIPSHILNDNKLLIKFDKKCSVLNWSECKYVANLMSTYRNREIIEKRIYGEPKLYKFENIEVFGVEQADEFLSHLYGKWRNLPPLDKQKTAHDFIELHLNKPYLDNK